MQDRQVFEQILGIVSPWFVADVELALDQGEVRVALEHRAEATWCCPECGQACPLHDHQEERRWRHLDTCQYQTLLSASLPRSRNKPCLCGSTNPKRGLASISKRGTSGRHTAA